MGFISSVNKPFGGIVQAAQPEPANQDPSQIRKAIKDNIAQPAGDGVDLPKATEGVNPVSTGPKAGAALKASPVEADNAADAAEKVGAGVAGSVGAVAERVGREAVATGERVVESVKKFFGGLFG